LESTTSLKLKKPPTGAGLAGWLVSWLNVSLGSMVLMVWLNIFDVIYIFIVCK
jgi:hypothetical protein